MSDPILGLTMLGLIVIAIMMGFPTAFTLMGMGMGFGFLAFWNPVEHWWQNRIFDLMVQRTFGAMNNDTLISIPLFVFMGYLIERAALVERGNQVRERLTWESIAQDQFMPALRRSFQKNRRRKPISQSRK